MHVDRGFRVQFQFRINSPLAEGFAFVVQVCPQFLIYYMSTFSIVIFIIMCACVFHMFQNHSHKCIGEGGSGLGYSGLPNSLAVEFDVRHNAEVRLQ